ncbi:MAG: AmmeMemoRadiSam system protein B [Ignavibacterium sp.]|nr:AmmeMemoRadiSam system protein B [Ignavibacterium sp.]MDW8374648.1 AmmeMemoRadiSam system protein B [Ignavibacteriales bacterium]
MSKIRFQQVAGYFYPSNPDKLHNDIETMMNKVQLFEKYDKIFGLVSPHAGYIYSGSTAAYAYYTLIDKNIKTVYVISPSHYEYFPGVSIYDGDAYQTPLGEIEIDQEKADELTKNSKIIFRGIQGHRKEHALEVQLPFLQYVLKDFKLVPIVMGDQADLYVNELSEKLASVVDENSIVVASSDLSHFYSAAVANELDGLVEKRINEFDYENLQKDLNHKKCEACGGGTIVALLKTAAMKNYNRAKVLKRTDSGDVTGDKSEVVGYLSAVVYS